MEQINYLPLTEHREFTPEQIKFLLGGNPKEVKVSPEVELFNAPTIEAIHTVIKTCNQYPQNKYIFTTSLPDKALPIYLTLGFPEGSKIIIVAKTDVYLSKIIAAALIFQQTKLKKLEVAIWLIAERDTNIKSLVYMIAQVAPDYLTIVKHDGGLSMSKIKTMARQLKKVCPIEIVSE